MIKKGDYLKLKSYEIYFKVIQITNDFIILYGLNSHKETTYFVDIEKLFVKITGKELKK